MERNRKINRRTEIYLKKRIDSKDENRNLKKRLDFMIIRMKLIYITN